MASYITTRSKNQMVIKPDLIFRFSYLFLRTECLLELFVRQELDLFGLIQRIYGEHFIILKSDFPLSIAKIRD